MIPADILTECRAKAEPTMAQNKPTSWIAAVVIVTIWLLLGILAVILIGRILKR